MEREGGRSVPSYLSIGREGSKSVNFNLTKGTGEGRLAPLRNTKGRREGRLTPYHHNKAGRGGSKPSEWESWVVWLVEEVVARMQVPSLLDTITVILCIRLIKKYIK